MILKKFLSRIIPSSAKTRTFCQKEAGELQAVSRLGCSTGNLRSRNTISLAEIFHSKDIDAIWAESKKAIDLFTIPDGTGGVNPGDRRALYYLINYFKPLSVLEIGTHIGASTLHIASALHIGQITKGGNPRLITVDIADVNSQSARPWVEYGASNSPLEMIGQLNYGSFVEFVTDTSLHYAATCGRTFDFIFLDGDHRAHTVYREIPVALSLLNPNGVILLHDYFPGMKPLWSNGSVIPGPYLAAERLKKEGANLTVLPLGELPWPTKLQSNVTSLALLLKNG